MEFSQYIKDLREKKRYSQRKLALLAGLSNTEIARIENGERKNPSPEVLEKLAAPLGVSYEELMAAAGYLKKAEPVIQAAHRSDDPLSDLPEEARRSLEEFKEFILKKYGRG